MFLAQGWHRTRFDITDVASSVPCRREWSPSFNLLAVLLVLKCSMLLACECCIGTLLSHVQLVIHQDLTPCSAKLVSRQWAPSLCCCMGLFHLSWKILCLPLLNCLSFLLAHYCSLLKPMWAAVQPSGTLTTASSLGSSAYLLRTFPVPLSSLLVKPLTVLVFTIPLLSGQHLGIELLTAHLWAPLSRQFLTHLAAHVSHPCFTSFALKIQWETVQNPIWSQGRRHTLFSTFFSTFLLNWSFLYGKLSG